MASADLYWSLVDQVDRGQTTWSEILSEISSIQSQTDSPDEHTFNMFIPHTIDIESYVAKTHEDINVIENLPNESPNNNPYYLYLRKELWEKLADDARVVAKIILDASPEDFREGRYGQCIFVRDTRNNCYNIKKKKVLSLLRNKRWGKLRIKKTLRALNDYCETIEQAAR
jgi:hypothetical protein